MNALRQVGGVVADYSHWVDHAHSLIAKGELPVRPFTNVDAAYGKHETCRLCSREISPSQVCYHAPGDQNGSMAFHVHCYVAWETAASGQ